MPSAFHCLLSFVSLACLTLAPVTAAAAPASEYTFINDRVQGEVDVNVVLSVGDDWAGADEATIVFCYENAANHLYLRAGTDGLELGRVRDGKKKALTRHSGWPKPSQEGSYHLTVMRRNWEIRVLCDGITVLHAWEAFAPGQQMGYAAAGVTIDDMYAQPIGEMMFADSFMRPSGEASPWDVVRGDWESVMHQTRNRKAQASKSANPFSYRVRLAEGQDDALTTAGYGFWDGYELRAAVRIADTGRAGLAGYVQDGENCYLFTVRGADSDAERSRSTAQLLKVIDGRHEQLDKTPLAVDTGKWYELVMTIHAGRIRGLVDGKQVCEARDDTFGNGRIGLYASECKTAYFDDVELGEYRRFAEDYSGDGYKPVEALSGRWTGRAGRLYGIPDGRSHRAISLVGGWQWRDCCVAVDVTPRTATSIGIYFGCTDKDNYYLFRWGPSHNPPYRTMQQLWKVDDGAGTILAERPASLQSEETYRVQVTADRNWLAVAVDDERCLQVADISRPSGGRAGYYAEGAGDCAAAFDNLRVSFPDPPKKPISITDQFTKEDTMANWARPMASWDALGGRCYCYTLPVWGDFNIRCELSHFLDREASIALRLGAEADGLAESKDVISVESVGEGTTIVCTVAEAGRAVDGGKVSVQDEEALLELERRGETVIARLDGQAIGWAPAEDGAAAPAVGLHLGGAGTSLNNVRLTSPNILDTAFSDAPTDWAPKSGTWEISDRWNCQPEWSWFCGREAETPLIWSKQQFGGDMVFEYWAAVMMDGQRGYSHPSDLNGIVCGDGEHLCSGYAFVFAGDNNTCTKLIRKGKTVAETTAVKFVGPNAGGDLNRFHRHWFHCRLEKRAGRLTFFTDGRKALHYRDPDPLQMGHVGMWTHQHNGILIARLRIAYQKSR